MANAIQKRQEANEDFKMHKKIKVLRKTQKKGGAAGIRTQVLSLAGADSSPAPPRELAECSLEVVFED